MTSAGRGRRRRDTAAASLVIAVGLILSTTLSGYAALSAQKPSEVEQSRRRLDEIRQERQTLERQEIRLQGQVSDVGATLRNLERQREATNQLVNIIETQIGGLGSQLDHSAAELTLAQDNLTDRKAVLQRRLADIYRRGPLYTFQVLLSAESFGELLTRYKYLYLTSRQDRRLVDDVETLTGNVQRERGKLLGYRTELDERKVEREAEVDHYAKLADQSKTQLTQLQKNSQLTKQKLTAAEKDEATITDLLATLTKNARAVAATRSARPETINTPVAGGLSTGDIGKLDWPVDGNIVINFGPDSLPDGGVVRWTGIGIKAAPGTPVKAVAAGTVMRVERLSTYGLSVVVQHGNGFFSLYMQLQASAVKEGQEITRGTVVGTVGGQNSPNGSHLYFEIRGANGMALDPIAWLRAKK